MGGKGARLFFLKRRRASVGARFVEAGKNVGPAPHYHTCCEISTDTIQHGRNCKKKTNSLPNLML